MVGQNNEEVGSVHEKANRVTSELRWDLKLSLFCGPLMVGAVILLLIALCCSLGITGLVGALDTIVCGITITVLSAPISLLETLLFAITLSAHHKWKVLEEIIEKKQRKRDKENSNKTLHGNDGQQHEQSGIDEVDQSPRGRTKRHQVLDSVKHSVMTDIEKLELDETFDSFEDNADKIPRFSAWRFLCCSWASLATLCGFLLFNASFNCIYWGLAITVLEFNPPVWYVYLLVNLLIGLAMPVLFCVSIFILATILEKNSPLDVQLKALVPAFLTFVTYNDKEEGKSTFPYWSIVGYFHFIIYPQPGRISRSNFWKSVKLNVLNASWFLMGIVFVTFCLSITYIVDQLLTAEQFVYSCSEVKGDGFHCFEHYSNRYINCSTDNTTRIELDCFRFNQVGVQSDPIGVIITAMFLYLACEKFLGITFKFIRELYKLYPGSIWGMWLTGLGLTLLIISCACTIIFDRVHSVYFEFQKLLQLYIISTDIFLSGLCMLTVEHVRSPDLIKHIDECEHVEIPKLEEVIDKASNNGDTYDDKDTLVQDQTPAES